MRQAMFDAELGDDVFEEDPTAKHLEEKAAKLLGKEAAIFVSSGTMGNLISILNHCNVRGCEMYCGAESHIALHEQGGASQIGGVTVCRLPNLPDGSFDLAELESKMRDNWQHEPFSRLVAVENTMNGRAVPQDWIVRLSKLASRHNLKMHLDGARLWNASVASGLPVDELVEPFDSVSFCLSKGLGAPAGSVLCGTADFVRHARRVRKVLGGGMRQIGVLAAAGVVALDEVVPILEEDHRRAREIAQFIADFRSDIISVDLARTHTNMVMIKFDSSRLSAKTFVARLQCVEDESDVNDRVIVRGLALTNELARLVFYHNIDEDMAHAALNKIRYVLAKFFHF